MINLRDKKVLIQEIKKNLLDLEEKNKIEKPPPVITTPTLITLDDSEILNQLRTNVELNKIQVGLMPHCGITNLGVTCYLNSVIQLLYSIPQVKYLFTNISQEKINQLTINSKENYETDQKKKKVLENEVEIKTIITKLLSKTTETIDQQRDAQEFIGEILGSFMDYLNEPLIKYLCDLFNFNFLFQKICKDEKTIINNNEEIGSILQIPINIQKLKEKKNDITLKNLIKLNSEREKLLESEYFKTDDCGDLQFVLNENGTKKEFRNRSGNPYNIQYNAIARQTIVKIQDNQKYLLIQLKRFQSNLITGGLDFRRKIITAIPFEKDLTIDEKEFRIHGIIRHKGGTDGGHYLYELFDEAGNRYKTFNDSQVSKPSGTIEELQIDAYVFLYRRI